jgi:glycosyltransferase involved in cell wall biosynthesis
MDDSNHKPELSAVTPFLNESKFISHLLSCYSKQDAEFAWEIIFSNSGSQDGTELLIRNFEDDLPPFEIVDSHEVSGAGYARNKGVAHSNSDNIAFCDADDLCFRVQLAGIKLHYWPEAVMYYKLRDTLWQLFVQNFR